MGDEKDVSTRTTAMAVAQRAANDAIAALETLDAQERSMQEIRSQLETLTPTGRDGFAARLEALERRAMTESSTPPDLVPTVSELVQSFQELRTSLSEEVRHVSERVDMFVTTQRAQLATPTATGLQSSPPGVGRKVLELMRLVPVIGKGREAKPEAGRSGPRYNFRGIDEAMDAVGHAMREVGLILQPKVLDYKQVQNPVQNGNRTVMWTTTFLTMRYLWIDPEDGSELPFEMVGEGKDPSDKASSKAASMACKYGLFQSLMIPVRGLDESDGQDPREEGDTQPPVEPVARPEEVATRALQAARGLPDARDRDTGKRFTQDEQLQQLTRIEEHAQAKGLMDVVVDNARLRMHLAGIRATYGEKSYEDLAGPPAAEPDYWSN